MNARPDQQITPLLTTRQLADFCARAARHPFLAVDTEFVGEGSYYPGLSLIQLAMPGSDPGFAAAVDPLSPQMQLDPLAELFANRSVVKIFHAARQDMAIFYREFGKLPEPVFDTQLAAMVCGYGVSTGYEVLVREIAGQKIDKSARLLDWRRRPLSQRLLRYALDDVVHLRTIYQRLLARIQEQDRVHWIDDENKVLTSPSTYQLEPADSWKKIKIRETDGSYLAVLRELAAFREELARRRNLPKTRILSDAAIAYLAGAKPDNKEKLANSRIVPHQAKRGEMAEGILNAVRAGIACPPDAWPRMPARRGRRVNKAALELVRIFLKIRADQLGVAEQILATADDLREIASGATDARPLSGWRRDVFGDGALRICRGQTAIVVEGDTLRLFDPKS